MSEEFESNLQEVAKMIKEKAQELGYQVFDIGLFLDPAQTQELAKLTGCDLVYCPVCQYSHKVPVHEAK